MNLIGLKQIVLNMSQIYKLIDRMTTEEHLENDVEKSTLDVSVAIIQLIYKVDIPLDEILADEQLKPIINRARAEIKKQNLSFAQVVALFEKNE